MDDTDFEFNLYQIADDFIETNDGIEDFMNQFILENLYKVKENGLPGDVNLTDNIRSRQHLIRNQDSFLDDVEEWTIPDLIWLVLNGYEKNIIYKAAMELRERFIIKLIDNPDSGSFGDYQFRSRDAAYGDYLDNKKLRKYY